MKLKGIFLFVGLITYVSGMGQTVQSITLSKKAASLEDLFKEINRQTGHEFVYNAKTLAAAIPVDINVKDATLEQVLAICFKNQPLKYDISGKTIVVKPLDKVESKIPEKTAGLHYVEGRVIDKSGGAIPGANVIIRGTSEGTVTDAVGKYSLQVNDSDLLLFSFIGFKRFETEVGERTVIDVVFEEDNATLQPVVVSTNYYEISDKLKTANIIKVTAKEIENQPVTNPLMALQGRVPGLEITPSNGAPGTAPTIRIRGTNSLRVTGKASDIENDGNYPLYVIDGVPVNSTPVSSYGSSYTSVGYDPLSTLSPSSIESIEVLKDGDATAIYGSRGANGVIKITTKKNLQLKEKTNIDISAYGGVGKITKRLSVLNGEEYVAMRKEALNNDGLQPGINDPDLTLWDPSRSTNWQEVLLGSMANISDIQASISAGSQRTSFRVGGGFHKETLVFPGDFYYSRGSGQVSLNHRSSNDRFAVSFSANYGFDKNHFFNDNGGGLLNAALSLPPNAPTIYRPDGSLNWEPYASGSHLLSSWTNPLASQNNSLEAHTRNLVTSINLSYDLTKDLVISVNGGYTDFNNYEIDKYPTTGQLPEQNFPPSANFVNNRRNSWILEPKVSYSKKISRHSLSALLGTTWQQSSNSINILQGAKYDSDLLLGSIQGASQIIVQRDDSFDYKYESLYGRIGYNWDQKYVVNLTGRRDGSSRFGPDKRYGNFGAVGIAWVFSSENFLKPITSVVNFGKLRASFGTTGSDQVGDYRYYELYKISQQRYNGTIGLSQTSLLNPSYAWEVTNKLETAFEFGLLENRLGIEVSWYRNRSSNQLIDYTLPVATGFSSVLQNFPAMVQNEGWEFILKADLLNSNALHWNISMNLSLPRNTLIKFDGLETSSYASYFKIGEPLSLRLLYQYAGVDPTTGLYQFADLNNDGQINYKDKQLMNPNERAFYGGFNNTIQCGAFEINFLIQFAKQNGQRYFSGVTPGKITNQPNDVLSRWQRNGDDGTTQKFTTSAEAGALYSYLLQSNFSIVDATFARLKTLSIAYRFDPKWSNKIGLQESKVFLQGQNLFTLTNYPGLDPETGNSLPPLTIVTVGLQLKF